MLLLSRSVLLHGKIAGVVPVRGMKSFGRRGSIDPLILLFGVAIFMPPVRYK